MRQPQSVGKVRGGYPRRLQLAVAAGLVLVVGCGLLLLPRLQSDPLVAYRSATEVPANLLSGPRVSVTLIRLRGGSGVRRVTAPRDAGALLIRIEPDSPPGTLGYAVRIKRQPGVVSRSLFLDHLRADADGYLELYLPLAAVAGQTLKVAVSPSPATDAEPLAFQLQIADPETLPATSP